MSSDVISRQARIGALYDAVASAVDIPDEDVWPGVMRAADPEEALWVLISIAGDLERYVPDGLANRIVIELPRFGALVDRVRAENDSRAIG
ncbi:hypothetical protein AAFP30_20375 [Gordonia sp. CPCC 205515]|uniref:hypothetical protein n=1 Tax=Gordonia sp. CPCC 205515 TaxID=3140791 RepID=UPI003AF39836